MIMPILATFYGIIISMYFGGREHLPPHFHAWYSGYEAEIDFDGNIIKGELPTRARNLVTAWVTLHSDELKAAWELCKNNELPPKIDPLR